MPTEYKILISISDAEVNGQVCDILNSSGFGVSPAFRSQEVFKLLGSGLKVNTIILEAIVDGIRVAEHLSIHRRYKYIPRIFLEFADSGTYPQTNHLAFDIIHNPLRDRQFQLVDAVTRAQTAFANRPKGGIAKKQSAS
jgi:hypothetical protein